MARKIILQPGYKINRLTVIKELMPRIRSDGNPRRVLLCRCACGIEKEILFDSVNRGRVYSCGCKQKEIVTDRRFAIKHGLSGHPIFTVWKRMIDRCTNPKHKGYRWYGKRGINICSEWLSGPTIFFNWAVSNGWEKGLQLDLINNDGNYEPNNCRFVSRKENMANRRPYTKRQTDHLLERKN
jgi:hypothetical protein